MEEKQSGTWPQLPLLVFTWEEKHVICVKTKLETLIVNVVCHDKIHMFGHIITY
jgi:hypothetical protein